MDSSAAGCWRHHLATRSRGQLTVSVWRMPIVKCGGPVPSVSPVEPTEIGHRTRYSPGSRWPDVLACPPGGREAADDGVDLRLAFGRGEQLVERLRDARLLLDDQQQVALGAGVVQLERVVVGLQRRGHPDEVVIRQRHRDLGPRAVRRVELVDLRTGLVDVAELRGVAIDGGLHRRDRGGVGGGDLRRGQRGRGLGRTDQLRGERRGILIRVAGGGAGRVDRHRRVAVVVRRPAGSGRGSGRGRGCGGRGRRLRGRRRLRRRRSGRRGGSRSCGGGGRRAGGRCGGGARGLVVAAASGDGESGRRERREQEPGMPGPQW